MDLAIRIFMCLFASVGIVHTIGWIICRLRRPKGLRRGYYAIPLYDDPDSIEAQLRHCLSRIRWGGYAGEIVLLVDMGLGEDSLAVCEKLKQGYGLQYCREERISETIRLLDELQIV